MSAESPLINAVRPEFIDKLDPQFVEIYTKYQGEIIISPQVPLAHPFRWRLPR